MEWSPALYFQAECHLKRSRQGVNSHSPSKPFLTVSPPVLTRPAPERPSWQVKQSCPGLPIQPKNKHKECYTAGSGEADWEEPGQHTEENWYGSDCRL